MSNLCEQGKKRLKARQLRHISGNYGFFLVSKWKAVPRKEGRLKISLPSVNICYAVFGPWKSRLEEMLNVAISAGAIYYGQPRQRSEVAFTPELRQTTERLASRMQDLFQRKAKPQGRFDAKCKNCSLQETCLPKTIGKKPSVAEYLLRMIDLPIT